MDYPFYLFPQKIAEDQHQLLRASFTKSCADLTKYEDYAEAAPTHEYHEGIFHTCLDQRIINCLDGRYMREPCYAGKRKILNSSRDHYIAPKYIAAWANAFRVLNTEALVAYTRDIPGGGLRAENFGSVVAMQWHSGQGTIDKGVTIGQKCSPHIDRYWRFLMLNITVNFKRKLLITNNRSKITRVHELVAGQVYMACPPAFFHEPKFYDTPAAGEGAGGSQTIQLSYMVHACASDVLN